MIGSSAGGDRSSRNRDGFTSGCGDVHGLLPEWRPVTIGDRELEIVIVAEHRIRRHAYRRRRVQRQQSMAVGRRRRRK